MNRALLVMGVAALAAVSLTAAPEKALAICSVLSHEPCTPYFGSVLRRHPFTPYSCGVSGGPCSPAVVLLGGNVPVLMVEGHAGPSALVDRDHPLDRLDEIALVQEVDLENRVPAQVALARQGLDDALERHVLSIKRLEIKRSHSREELIE